MLIYINPLLLKGNVDIPTGYNISNDPGDLERADLVFCTLQESYKSKNANIIHEPYKHIYTNYFEESGLREYMLNWDFEIKTVGQIEKEISDPREYFIRPNRGDKPFTGFTGTKEEIVRELSFQNISLSELCILAPAQNLSNIEYRTWFYGGKYITYAPYSWESIPLIKEIDPDILDYCIEIESKTEYFGEGVVIDWCVLPYPAILETNAFSTSGLYEGVDLEKIITSIR